MLELISIHINKTAGTSFEQILRNNYEFVFRINTHDGNKIRRGRSCDGANLINEIPANANVIHGHFKAREISAFIGLVPIITWVRNPVDRVISNYFYTQKQTQQSILEYTHDKHNQNKMSTILNGLDIKDFFFIGVQEYFCADLNKICSMLGWKNNAIQKLNSINYDEVSADIKKQIGEINKYDIDLYNKIVELRGYV